MKLYKCIKNEYDSTQENAVFQEDSFDEAELENLQREIEKGNWKEVDYNQQFYICNTDVYLQFKKGYVYEKKYIITCIQFDSIDWTPISFIPKKKQDNIDSQEIVDIKNSLDVQIGGNHYKNFVIQPVEFCIKNQLDFVTGNIIKYILRKKGDKAKRLEDLEKAKHYLDILIDYETNKL